MKKIINGRLYDTDTARCIGSDSYGDGTSDFHHYSEELYVKRTGEFFLYGEGGPLSRYSRSTGNNLWSGGEKIIPLNLEAARQWAEEHLDADDYAAAFGLPDEDAEDVRLNLQLPASLNARLRQLAAGRQLPVSTLVVQLIEQALDG